MLLSFVWRNCHSDELLLVGRCGRGSVDLALLVSQTGCEGSPSVISCVTPGKKTAHPFGCAEHLEWLIIIVSRAYRRSHSSTAQLRETVLE